MGHEELITSLRKETEERIAALKERTDKEIQRIRTDLAGKIDTLREEYRAKQELAHIEEEENMRSEAEKTVRRIRLNSEKALADRLLPIAFSCLPSLRDRRYEKVFASLVHELPSRAWSEVWVHADDTNRAKEYFPGARVFVKDTITGGFEVSRDEGKVLIANTFEKRLERAWEDLFPPIMKDCYQEGAGHGNPPE